MQRLVTGTGLNVRVSAPGSAALVAPGVAAVDTVNAPADGSLVLETITVQGTNPNSTMALPEAYAGGQAARGGQVGMLGNRDVMNTPFGQTNYTNKTIQNQQTRTEQDVMNNDPSVVATSSGTTFSWENDPICRRFSLFGGRRAGSTRWRCETCR